MKNATAKTQRLEALAKISGSNDKAFWRKIGVAFPLKNREGYSLKLELMPVPTEGAVEFILVVPTPYKKAEKA